MSTQTITKKRKSVDGSASAAKKVKVAKSADKPAPVKSALKKPVVEKETEVKTKTKPKDPIEAHKAKQTKPATKPAKPAKKTEKVVIQDNSDNEDGGNTLTADQTASLLAGFSSESEGGDSDEESQIPNSKLPKAPTQGDISDRIASAVASAKTSSSKDADPETTPGIIYIGRIPHGFHEPQMRAYFSQFGKITHLKLARNRKTGKSKHFAFLEFASSAVADIVAKTMDKYLLFGHILQVRRVPSESVGEGVWKGEGRRGWNVRPNNKIERGSLRRGRTREQWEKRVGKEERRRAGKEEKLREIGYDFEMPALKKVGEVAVKGKGVEEAKVGAGGEAPEAVVEEVKTVGEDGEGNPVVERKTEKRAAEGKPKVKEAKKAVKKVKT